MPATTIDVRYQYSIEQEVELIGAVQKALVSAFKIPDDDCDICLIVHEPHRFLCPPNKLHPEKFTRITIDCFVGRTLDTKRNLYLKIVDNVSVFGIPKDHIKIIVREISTENWGVRGGQAACDIDLGFDIQI